MSLLYVEIETRRTRVLTVRFRPPVNALGERSEFKKEEKRRIDTWLNLWKRRKAGATGLHVSTSSYDDRDYAGFSYHLWRWSKEAYDLEYKQELHRRLMVAVTEVLAIGYDLVDTYIHDKRRGLVGRYKYIEVEPVLQEIRAAVADEERAKERMTKKQARG